MLINTVIIGLVIFPYFQPLVPKGQSQGQGKQKYRESGLRRTKPITSQCTFQKGKNEGLQRLI